MSHPERPTEDPQPPGMQDLIEPDVLKRAGLDASFVLEREAEGASYAFHIGSVVDKSSRVVVVEERRGETGQEQRWRVGIVSDLALGDEERLEREIRRLSSGFTVGSESVSELVRLLGPKPPREPSGGS